MSKRKPPERKPANPSERKPQRPSERKPERPSERKPERRIETKAEHLDDVELGLGALEAGVGRVRHRIRWALFTRRAA